MANPTRYPGDREDDPHAHSASPGERSDRDAARQRASWRDKYPGWETFEGRPNDPRFLDSTDPNKDPRYDTHLRESSTLPRGSAAMWLWLVVLGIVLMTLFAVAMFRHFQQPAPRSPDQAGQSSLRNSGIVRCTQA